MSSELKKILEHPTEKDKNLINARVLSFPNEQTTYKHKKIITTTNSFWKINDKSNEDQFRAVVGVCYMVGALILIGLYSNLI
tara:strand:+ start:244 stop:489 length:246 start_codon:yes stop_codon:yes gene_type:complete